jgi:FkbM family methyltransferase
MREGWATRHPDWEMKLWREDDLHWLRHSDLVRRAPCYAQKADIARYEVVQELGGVYIDTDFECLRPLDALVHDLEFFACRHNSGYIANGIFGSVAGHPLLEEVLACLPISCYRYRARGINHQTGPGLFTRIVDRSDHRAADGVRIFPPQFFFPYDYTEPHRAGETFSTSYAVHRWANSWRAAEPLRLRPRDLAPSDVHAARASARFLLASCAEAAVDGAQRHLGLPTKRGIERLLKRAAAVLPRPMQAVPYGTDRLLVRTRLGLRLLCSVRDLSLTPELATDGIYDEPFVDLLIRALRPGMTFVDVGANVGLFTLIAASVVGTGGRVVAYECNPELLELLHQNVDMNWLGDRVSIVPQAAHAARGTIRFSVPSGMYGLGSTYVHGGGPQTKFTEFRVETESLDAGLAEHRFLDLVKIDVEGGEADVLDGMVDLLASKRVGMLALEYRIDLLRDEQRLRMEKHLARFNDEHGATFHVPGRTTQLQLDEVLVVAHFGQLIVRLPWSSIAVDDLSSSS